MGAKQLEMLTRYGHGENPHFTWLTFWTDKLQYLQVSLGDLQELASAYTQAKKDAIDVGEGKFVFNAVPQIRLANSIESLTNCFYGMTEIAAKFASACASKAGYAKTFPRGFNRFANNLRNGEYQDLKHIDMLSEVAWYARIREIRTEVAHHSTIFIGEDNGEVAVVINCLRNSKDKIEYADKIVISVSEFRDICARALSFLEVFADFLAYEFVIPGIELDQKINVIKRDQYGMPAIKDGLLVAENEQSTMRDYVESCGYCVEQTD